MIYKFYEEKRGLGVQASVNEELAQELHKPVIKKFKRRKVYTRFKDNIWVADLAETEIFVICGRCFHQIGLWITFER